jgi:hypothetical protein
MDKNNDEFNKLYNLLCSLSTKSNEVDTLSTKSNEVTEPKVTEPKVTEPKVTEPLIKSTFKELIQAIERPINILIIDDPIKEVKDLVIKDLDPAPFIAEPEKRKYNRKTNKQTTFRIQYPSISQLSAECYTKAITGLQPRQCRFCDTVFQTDADHTAHYKQSITCNRMAIEEWKKIVYMI